MKRTAMLIALVCAALASAEVAADPLLFMPFKFGTCWWCPQGVGGSFSHTGSLYHSYDFTKTRLDRALPERSFGEPIYAPFEGTVHTVVNWVPDWVYNDYKRDENNRGWGNIVLLRDDDTGKCLRICHFQQNSIVVQPGQRIEAGTLLGNIGMTGVSTNPHLHMHLQDNCGDFNSVPFAFVEGPVVDDINDWNVWKDSHLMMRSSVLDEDGSTNLGHYFAETRVSRDGAWQAGGLNTGFVGRGYVAHQSQSSHDASFSWYFKMRRAGYYVIFAKWTHHSNRDPRVKYYVLGDFRYRNQRQETPTKWTYLGWAYLTPGEQYQISAIGTTPGTYVVADAIILVKID